MAREVKEHTTRNSCLYMILQVMNIGAMLLAKQQLVDSRMGSQRLVEFSSQFHQGSRKRHPRNEFYDTAHQDSNMKPHTRAKRWETLRKRDKLSRKIRTSRPLQLSQYIRLTNRAISTTSHIHATRNFSLTEKALIYIERVRSVQLAAGQGRSRASSL